MDEMEEQIIEVDFCAETPESMIESIRHTGVLTEELR